MISAVFLVAMIADARSTALPCVQPLEWSLIRQANDAEAKQDFFFDLLALEPLERIEELHPERADILRDRTSRLRAERESVTSGPSDRVLAAGVMASVMGPSVDGSVRFVAETLRHERRRFVLPWSK